MGIHWNTLWRRLSARDTKDKAEVERISTLQKSAVTRRAEHAQKKAQAALTGDASLGGLLSSSRKQVEVAEAAYTAALQQWENKQSRQKSR